MQKKHPAVRYHLRANLTFDHHVEEEKALWRIIRRGCFDEVMFFVPHAEERSDGLGTTADHERMIAILAPLFERMRSEGIAPSINIWWTAAFSEFAGMRRDLSKRFNFRWAMALDGRISRSAACLRCPAWREQVAGMYGTYAALKPARLWIDDDVRSTLRADMQSPCFCDVCLASISSRIGTQITRETLLPAIMADPPNPVRSAWLADQGELIRDVVAMLADAVHEASPQTCVSLMHSCPEQHSAEGRRWADLVAALGQPKPMLRPSIGTYSESTGATFASALAHAGRSIAAYPAGVDIAPEIETYPQSRYGKSLAGVAADLMLAQFMGAREMTFSIYRFAGRMDLEIQREDVWSGMLAGIKRKLQALAELDIRPSQQRGVGLVWREDEAAHARSVQAQTKPIFLFRHHPWDHVLPLLGIAVAHGRSRVVALSGEQPAGLTPEEIKNMASGGLLLDARAAETLIFMGYGNLIGLSKRIQDAAASHEIIEDAAFGGIAGDVINCRWTSLAWQFDLMPGARAISSLRGYRGEGRGHGVVIFENNMGGRVVTIPFDSQVGEVWAMGIPHPPFESPSFLNRVRQAQVRDALAWAGRSPLLLRVEDAPMAYPMLIEQARRLVIGVANLMPDPVESLALRLAKPAFLPTRLKVLSPAGRWRACAKAVISTDAADDSLLLQVPISMAYMDVAAMLLE